MLVQIHQLKIRNKFFLLVANGEKRFELRRNDRNYKLGDFLMLHDVSDEMGSYSGNKILASVDSILSNFDGLEDGFVIMSISIIKIY